MTNTDTSKPPTTPIIDQRQIQYLVPLVLTFLGPWLAKNGITTAQANDFINATLTYGLTYGLPALSWAYTAWITRRKARLQATASIPGVSKIVMTTQTQADAVAPKDASGTPQPDNILSPSEDLTHVAAQSAVAAVVMKSAATADLNPSEKVVGPQMLKAPISVTTSKPIS